MNAVSSTFELALVGQVLIWIFVALLFHMTRQASIYHPLSIYLLFHGLVFVVRPLLVHYLDFDAEWRYMGFGPTQPQLIRSLAASSLGLVVAATSVLAFGWCPAEFKTSPPRPFTAEQRTALLVVSIALAPLIGYSIRSLLGGGLQIENRGNTYVMVGDSGYTLEAQYMAGPLICAWLALKRFQWPAVLPIIPYVVYRTYCGMSRWTIVLLFLVLMLVYTWQRRAKWPPAWTLLCALPVFLLFRAIGDNREFLHQLMIGEEYRRPTEYSVAQKWKAKYDNPDFANFDFLTFVVAMVPERTGTYTYGAQYLQLFTEPIPRKLWKDKPVGVPIRSFNLSNYGNFLGLTPSLVGDGWNSGGWVGIIVTMTLVGAALGLAHRWFWRCSENNMVALFYLVGLAMLPQWFRDGSISIAKFLFWNLSPLVLWVAMTWLLGHRTVPGYSVLLPGDTRVRLLNSEGTPAPTEPHAPISSPGSPARV